ncbi:MAG: ribulose-phosphate 3-epimerase [Candidatus Planktophila sp.]|jgi:ribulose-phosphate 3-epimerase|tara:strand:- start:1826 stop:2494 length:669 start_codon:yes stop_codon:yes gene_type:complete
MVAITEVRITPSILNADRLNLQSEISKIAAVSDFIHLDIMDGKFVPNVTWDFAGAEEIIKSCPIPIDSHLMIADVDRIARDYAAIGSASVTIHAEASENPGDTLKEIRRLGARAGLAIKPGSDIDDYAHLLNYADMFLIMTVEPGFGGQKFMLEMMDKVAKTKNLIGDRPIWLQVDGGISLETINIARDAGANTFVAGSAVFNAENPAAMVEILRHRAMEIK